MRSNRFLEKMSLNESFDSTIMSNAVREHGRMIVHMDEDDMAEFCGDECDMRNDMYSLCANISSPMEYDKITNDMIMAECDDINDALFVVYSEYNNVKSATDVAYCDDVPYYRNKLILFEDGSVIVIEDSDKSMELQVNAFEKVNVRKNRL